MPFDSSKVKYHDQVDMFFRMQNRKRPEGAPGKIPKKKPAAKDQATAGGNKKYDDYINAFE